MPTKGERVISDGSEVVFPSDPDHAQVVARIEENQRQIREAALKRRAELAEAEPDADEPA